MKWSHELLLLLLLPLLKSPSGLVRLSRRLLLVAAFVWVLWVAAETDPPRLESLAKESRSSEQVDELLLGLQLLLLLLVLLLACHLLFVFLLLLLLRLWPDQK